MDDEYYDKDSVEYVVVKNKLIEIDNSVLTDFTFVIECDSLLHDYVYKKFIDMITKSHIIHCIGLVLNNKYFIDYDPRDYKLSNDKNKIKMYDNRIEIKLGLFETNISDNLDNKYKGFPLYLYNLIHGNKESINISTYIDKIYSDVDVVCYFKYKKYAVNEKMLSNYPIKFYNKSLRHCKINNTDNNTYTFFLNNNNINYTYINIDCDYDNIKEIKLLNDDGEERIVFNDCVDGLKYIKINSKFKCIKLCLNNFKWKKYVEIIITSYSEIRTIKKSEYFTDTVIYVI